nr:hypothetical protein [Streptomyces olivoreticuli]
MSLFGLVRARRKIPHCLIREMVCSTDTRRAAWTLFGFFCLPGSSVFSRRLIGVMTVPLVPV